VERKFQADGKQQQSNADLGDIDDGFRVKQQGAGNRPGGQITDDRALPQLSGGQSENERQPDKQQKLR